MDNRLVLVDSSAWINHLMGSEASAASEVGKLLSEHRVATNEIVRLEVLTGAKDEKQYAELADAFEGLHFLMLSGAVWRQAERLRFDLRRKGHLLPVPDVVIASTAMMYNCHLLHSDHHFDVIARFAPLHIF